MKQEIKKLAIFSLVIAAITQLTLVVLFGNSEVTNVKSGNTYVNINFEGKYVEIIDYPPSAIWYYEKKYSYENMWKEEYNEMVEGMTFPYLLTESSQEYESIAASIEHDEIECMLKEVIEENSLNEDDHNELIENISGLIGERRDIDINIIRKKADINEKGN